jgi:hypothetical protein
MAWFKLFEGQSKSSASFSAWRQRNATDPSGGPKEPPTAPPAIPPIIINPYTYQMPEPAIDPRHTPPGPPIMPPPRPAMSLLPA